MNGIAIGNVVVQKLNMDENLIRHMILNSIRLYRAKYKDKFGEIVICDDGRNNWRKDYFPNYKFKRSEARDKSTVDWDELFRILSMIKSEMQENLPYKFLNIEGCEADDIIAQLTINTQEFGNYEPVMIISADKDFAQLQKYDNVFQYSPMTKKMIVETEPEQNLLNHILRGDGSDGIPNVLSGDDCFVAGRRQSPVTKKVLRTLLEDPNGMGEEVYRNIQRNKILIDLTQIPVELKEKIINTFNSMDKSSNRSKVMNYLVENRCRLLLEEIGDFINV